MPHRFIVLIASVLVLVSAIAPAAEKGDSPAHSAIGKKIDNFTLQDFRGRKYSLDEFKDIKFVVVAFLGTECPLVKLYADRLVEMQTKYGAEGVAFIGINANRQDSITEIAHHARVHKIDFPVLKDTRNEVADLFAAERTPEVFVLDQDRSVRYHGRIDDQFYYEIQRTGADNNYLADALDQLLSR